MDSSSVANVADWTPGGVLILLAGILIVVVVNVDALTTTFNPGPHSIAGRLLQGYAARATPDSVIWRHRRGAWVLAGMLATWMLTLWFGWAVVFCATDFAAVSDRAGEPVTWVDRFYYTGSAVTTLGEGDVVPGTPFFQILGILAALNGFMIITLSASATTPIMRVRADAEKLTLAVHLLGHSGDAVVRQAKIRQFPDALDQSFTHIAPQLIATAREFTDYPAALYFRPLKPQTTLSVALAVLDDTLVRLKQTGLEHRPSWTLLENALEAAVNDLSVRLPADPTPTPAPESPRRHKIAALLRREGCDWPREPKGVDANGSGASGGQ